MRLPMLGETPASREVLPTFGGYNATLMAGQHEFARMENMSSSRYPALSPRPVRSQVRRLERPNGLFAHEKLCWVDGTGFYYGGEKKGDVADGKKQLLAMGAYIVIWPDKLLFNTQTGDMERIDARHVTTGTVSFTLCRADGSAYTDYTTGAEAPDGPTDGQLWVNTAQTPHVLMQYSKLRGMWVSMPTSYVRISAPGIGAEFAAFDGVTISGCTDEGLNGDRVLQDAQADALVVAGILDKTFTQTAALTIAREAPEMDFVAEQGNRLWGCSSAAHEIYACKLGDAKNWRCYAGVASDSYAATVGSAGDFTGACTHLGYVLFFKEHVIHKVYGTKPSNFQLMETSARGVQAGSEGSLAVVQERLFYKAAGDVCAYGTALPQGISQALGDGTYSDAVAGVIGERYYISMRDAAGDGHLFVYDAGKGMWHREDGTKAVAFARLDGTFYCLRDDGWLLALLGPAGPYRAAGAVDEARVDWMVETPDIGVWTPDRKYLTMLQLRMDVPRGALVRVLVDYDRRGVFREVYRANPDRSRAYAIPVYPRRCDTLRLRLEGYGDVVVHALGRTTQAGSEKR